MNDDVLITPPNGRSITLRDGPLPLLLDLTFEDKAAKGLRAHSNDAAPPTLHVSALEQTGTERLLLLLGPPGSGKTMFARNLVSHLQGEAAGDPDCNLARLCQHAVRNPKGAVVRETWEGGAPRPVLVTLSGPCRLDDIAVPEGETLLIIDDLERLGTAGPAFLHDAAGLSRANPHLRLLLLGDSAICQDWPVPPGMDRQRLLPLFAAQRIAFRERHSLAFDDSEALTTPGLLALAPFTAGPAPSPAALVASWRETTGAAWPGYLRAFADAATLSSVPQAAAQFGSDPTRWAEPLRLFADGLPDKAALGAALLAQATPPAILLAADLHAHSAELTPALLHLLPDSTCPATSRASAARHLARLGDPRDLEELCDVPPGILTMGSATHPNSTPVHAVPMAGFRIGRYPVTNQLYRRFIAATARPWRSATGLLPERANHPATDLTWYDAVACCAWLTETWRATGRIAAHDIVRLPTEPEWEYAARLDRPDTTAVIHPWPGAWQPDHANDESTGFNDICAVGLFPDGRAPSGADDMAGQVWEWCSTLWGADMATPTWRYPTARDGREAPTAAPNLRRVLRGGCFSSGPAKANATYRGSLEPDGFWRGNGFRVVVSAAGPVPSG